MHHRQISTIVCVVALGACLGLTAACWKTDKPEPAVADKPPAKAVDLGRDDMAALPGAEIDTQLLEQFPYFLRQESSMSRDAVFAYYDEFFSGRGWVVEASIDPITQAGTHRYRLGNELAFVSIREIEPGRNEVVLSRRELKDGEAPDTMID